MDRVSTEGARDHGDAEGMLGKGFPLREPETEVQLHHGGEARQNIGTAEPKASWRARHSIWSSRFASCWERHSRFRAGFGIVVIDVGSTRLCSIASRRQRLSMPALPPADGRSSICWESRGNGSGGAPRGRLMAGFRLLSLADVRCLWAFHVITCSASIAGHRPGPAHGFARRAHRVRRSMLYGHSECHGPLATHLPQCDGGCGRGERACSRLSDSPPTTGPFRRSTEAIALAIKRACRGAGCRLCGRRGAGALWQTGRNGHPRPGPTG